MDIEEKELGRQYQGWIKEALKQGNLRRNGVWSSELAVGDDGFVEKVKKSVGAWVAKMVVNEDQASYGQDPDIKDNYLDWQIFEDNDL